MLLSYWSNPVLDFTSGGVTARYKAVQNSYTHAHPVLSLHAVTPFQNPRSWLHECISINVTTSLHENWGSLFWRRSKEQDFGTRLSLCGRLRNAHPFQGSPTCLLAAEGFLFRKAIKGNWLQFSAVCFHCLRGELWEVCTTRFLMFPLLQTPWILGENYGRFALQGFSCSLSCKHIGFTEDVRTLFLFI